MMPSVLRVSGPAFIRNGDTQPTTPRALVSWCDHPDCHAYAPYGYQEGGKLKTYCKVHRPEESGR